MHYSLGTFLTFFHCSPLQQRYRKLANMMPKNRKKCLQDSILIFLPSYSLFENLCIASMPHLYIPMQVTMFNMQPTFNYEYLQLQFTNRRASTIWPTVMSEAICLLSSILKPALLQSSKYTQRIPQKCWCCHAIMYMNMAKGQTMQTLLLAATHPKQTGRLPTMAPKNVFNFEVRFIGVQRATQPIQMAAPIMAVLQLQKHSPSIPVAPKAIPSPSANFLLNTSCGRGLCLVLTIILSYSTSMYWLITCVDMDKASEPPRSGSMVCGDGYKQNEHAATMLLRTESLNLVSYDRFLAYFLKVRCCPFGCLMSRFSSFQAPLTNIQYQVRKTSDITGISLLLQSDAGLLLALQRLGLKTPNKPHENPGLAQHPAETYDPHQVKHILSLGLYLLGYPHPCQHSQHPHTKHVEQGSPLLLDDEHG